jgi:RND superfamily putative drug exporter
MYKHLGNFVSRRWILVFAAWAAVAVAAGRLAPRWDDVTHDGDLAYLPERMTTVRGEKLLAQAFPNNKSKSQLVLVAAREDRPLSDDDKTFLVQLAGRFGTLEQDETFEDPSVEAHDQPILEQMADPALSELDRLWLRLSLKGKHGLGVVGIWTPETEIVGRKLVSGDQKAALAVLSLSSEFMAVKNIDVVRTVTRTLDLAKQQSNYPAGLELGITGSGAIGGDMMASAEDSVQNTEVTTIGLVLVILALVYRAPALVLIPLVTIGLSVFVSTHLLAMLTQVNQLPGFEWLDFKVFKTTKIFVVTILFGAGTDFCLFLISRYREEMEKGLSRPEALAAAIAQVGDAITASAATTIFGLSMLYFADFGKFTNSGPAIGLCLAVALLACLTLAPALLRAFGPLVFWPSKVGRKSVAVATESSSLLEREAAQAGTFWNWASRVIMAKPGLILVGSVLLMAPLAVQGWSVKISYNLLSELDPKRPSVVGTSLTQSHFKPGDMGPVTILVHKQTGKFNTSEGEKDIARLTRALYGKSPNGGNKIPDSIEWKYLQDLEGVESVRSAVEPMGDTPADGLGRRLSAKELAARRAIFRNPRTKAAFLTQVPELEGQVTRLDVVLKHDPFSAEAAEAYHDLDVRLTALAKDKNSPWYNEERDPKTGEMKWVNPFDFVGTTAGTADLKAVTESDQTLIQSLVVLAVLAILIVLLRRPLICLYLIVSVLFSYYVAIGATELFFTHYFDGFEGLDWKVPIFLFVILIAVGEDYNIYLVTRVVEEQQRWGLREGLRLAVARTGGIITSCGVIMAGTFVSMMTGSLRGMLELGFALTLGVMLDTVVVRPVLVPAFLALLYRRGESHPPTARTSHDVFPATTGTLHSTKHHGERKEKERAATR